MASSLENLRKKSINLLIEEMNRQMRLKQNMLCFIQEAHRILIKRHKRRAIKALKRYSKPARGMQGFCLKTQQASGDITSEIKELAEIWMLLGLISGICIDTCHAFAAGYDVRKDKGIRLLSGK